MASSFVPSPRGLAAVVAVLLAGCQQFAGHESRELPLPPRDEGFSISGPGHEKIDRTRFEPARFAQGSWTLAPREAEKVRRVSESLKPGSRLLLAGFGLEAEGPEAARVLSMRRALEVRRLLVASGVDPSLVHCAGFGADWGFESHAARVEFGVEK